MVRAKTNIVTDTGILNCSLLNNGLVLRYVSFDDISNLNIKNNDLTNLKRVNTEDYRNMNQDEISWLKDAINLSKKRFVITTKMKIMPFYSFIYMKKPVVHYHIVNSKGLSIILVSDFTVLKTKPIFLRNLDVDMDCIDCIVDFANKDKYYVFSLTYNVAEDFTNLGYFSFLCYLRLKCFDRVLLPDFEKLESRRMAWSVCFAHLWSSCPCAIKPDDDTFPVKSIFYFIPDHDELGFRLPTACDLKEGRRWRKCQEIKYIEEILQG